MAVTTDSSPFQSSPLESTTSPRLFWQNRNLGSENAVFGLRSSSPSPTRRTSLERLQKASRVKNSNILALEQKQEYDPARIPHVERPLAKVQGNAFGGTGIAGLRAKGDTRGHQRSESKTNIPLYSPSKPSSTVPSVALPHTPSKDQMSPIKSSLSTGRFKSSVDNELGDLFIDTPGDERQLPVGKSLHRHAKSVTFDAAPPQVNEYEMATPDLSSIGSNSREGSYESEDDDETYRSHGPPGEGDGHEDSFDASLEDTDKTPVVGPDDWRQDSPIARDAAERNYEFDGSPLVENVPSAARPQHHRTESSNSNGDHRPLPPLPGLQNQRSSPSPSLSATADRMLGSQRTLPSPPPASSTKAEIQNIGSTKMTLEERLKLMMLSDDGKSAAEQQRERRLRRAGTRDRYCSPTPERETDNAEDHDEGDDNVGELSGLEEYQLPPRISRESILRRVNGNKADERQSDYNFSSPAPSSSPERPVVHDRDVPIPSTEDSLLLNDIEGDEIDKTNGIDPHSISDLYAGDGLGGEDTDSHYSDGDGAVAKQKHGEGETASTPRAGTPVAITFEAGTEKSAKSSTEAAGGIKPYTFPKPEEIETGHSMTDAHAYLRRPATPDAPLPKPEYDGSGWGDDYEFDEPGTPESVIHHPVADDSPRNSPAVPEQLATIKASGSKLKTRPSATPSDLMAMREARRQVSREVPAIPPIPERHRNRLSRDMEAEQDLASSDDFLERHPSFKKRSLTLELDLGLSLDQDFERVIEAQKVASDPFLIPPLPNEKASEPEAMAVTSESASCKDGTDVLPGKQRGYLMRQNTKLVTASDKDAEAARGTRSAGNSPVKKERPQSWTVEPWNGQVRKKSIRKRTALAGPVPPLPGQESNAATLNPLVEEDFTAELATGESGERGRLFVKVVGVKDLDLPLPKGVFLLSHFVASASPHENAVVYGAVTNQEGLVERTWFSLTLDNGVHCVTTAWLELARNAPIGQEFELVVPNDLEFQLTLNVKLEAPAPRVIAQSPSKSLKPKTSTFSRVFASPKKRKEMELRQREEEERIAREHREAQSRQVNAQPTAWELLSPLVADDGSFARAYVCLKEHETRCFGRPYVVDVACFNEWATEEAGFASSVKSKRGNTAVVRRAPYKVGKLELQLLFVPRPKGAGEDDMPKSMNSCIREMKAAEDRLSRNWEGHLSQQGGDCPVSRSAPTRGVRIGLLTMRELQYWRRRYFKLAGTKLTAYHEATRQPRATINLANAKRLIDDRRALTEKETTGRNGKRRRSAFAEEEEGYMFVEEGFRIRFNNGEVIDFYADTAQDKEGWMRVLSEVVGRDSLGTGDDEGTPRTKGKWCELVLKREDALRRRAEGRRVHSRTKSMFT
jgi:hypothetical protein